MNSQPSGLEDLQERVAKLERQNRGFKKLGTVMLAITALIVVMGQAPANKTVEANEFILRDGAGNVRVKLSMQNAGFGGGMPQMVFLDSKGTPSLELDGSATGLFGGTVGINDEQGRRVSSLFANSTGGMFWISNGHPIGKGSSGVWMTPGNVEVSDEEGFEARIGTQGLVTPSTGETHKTSAASLVLLDKNKIVIWQAP